MHQSILFSAAFVLKPLIILLRNFLHCAVFISVFLCNKLRFQFWCQLRRLRLKPYDCRLANWMPTIEPDYTTTKVVTPHNHTSAVNSKNRSYALCYAEYVTQYLAEEYSEHLALDIDSGGDDKVVQMLLYVKASKY